LDLYFKLCSINVSVVALANLGRTLASGGLSPSGKQIFKPESVKYTNALLATCGVYDGAGDFLFHFGVPSTSGISGGMLTIIPGVGALASYSPLVDKNKMSVRGSMLINELAAHYDLNVIFDHPQKTKLNFKKKDHKRKS